jgi:hypothetical protein
MLKAGLYDDLLTLHLREAIDQLRVVGIESLLGKVEPAQLPDYLTRFLAAKLSCHSGLSSRGNIFSLIPLTI